MCPCLMECVPSCPIRHTWPSCMFLCVSQVWKPYSLETSLNFEVLNDFTFASWAFFTVRGSICAVSAHRIRMFNSCFLSALGLRLFFSLRKAFVVFKPVASCWSWVCHTQPSPAVPGARCGRAAGTVPGTAIIRCGRGLCTALAQPGGTEPPAGFPLLTCTPRGWGEGLCSAGSRSEPPRLEDAPGTRGAPPVRAPTPALPAVCWHGGRECRRTLTPPFRGG